MMETIDITKKYTLEEYILIEEAGDLRHEFINGNLYEMSGAPREHHFICQFFLFAFFNKCVHLGYKVYIENMKVAIPGGNRFYYPDVFISKELLTEKNRYIQFEPELIVEVLSDTSRRKDKLDKFIQYQKIESLKYYLLAEPEKCLIDCYSKQNNREWEMNSYTQMNEIIPLPHLGISLPLSEIYTS